MTKTSKFINSVLEKHKEKPSDVCIIWPYANNGNYANVTINKKLRYVHRLILCEITQKYYNYELEAAHNCGNSLCINPAHLEWKTPFQNEKDKLSHGTRVFGEKHPNKTLTSEDVSNIRKLRASKSASFKEISEIYDIGISYAIRINSGKARKYDGKI